MVGRNPTTALCGLIFAGEETVRSVRHIARSFEPEPVTDTVIGIVIIVDEMQTTIIRSTSTKTLETRQR
jgi:hypothetical protein